MYLLDSDTVTGAFQRHPQINHRVTTTPPELVWISSIAVEESDGRQINRINTIMKIWEVKHQVSVDVALIAYKCFDDIDPKVLFKGKRLAGSWKVPAAQLNPAQPGARVVDFPFFEYGALLCSTNAWNILRPFLESEVEVLLVDVEGHSYQLLNPIQVTNCLDKEQSRMTYSKTGRVIDIQHYVFNQEKLVGVYLFKTPELTPTHIYATEAFQEIIAKNQMTGLEFRDLP